MKQKYLPFNPADIYHLPVTKLIVSGKMLEVYKYWSAHNLPKKIERKKPVPKEYTKEYLKYRKDKLKSDVTRIVECNDFERFLTLTYKENQKDYKTAYTDFKVFIRRLEKYLKMNVGYLEVPERQKRGAIHFHVLLECPYVHFSVLTELWGKGNIDISDLKDRKNQKRSERRSKRRAVKYICKYVTKDLLTGDFYHKKKYTTSENLKRPVVYYNEDAEAVLTAHPELFVHYQNTFKTTHMGDIEYTKYRTDEPPMIKRMFYGAITIANTFLQQSLSP